MSTKNQVRALMMRHQHMIKNREQSMLGRAAAEIGVDIDAGTYHNHIQGKIHPTFRTTYDRSGSAMS